MSDSNRQTIAMFESIVMTMADAQRIASAGLMTEEVHVTLRGNLLHCLDEAFFQDVSSEPAKERIIERFDDMSVRVAGEMAW